MKALFTDLDGTLLNNDSVISDYTKEYLLNFMNAGNKLILSSGRPLDSVKQVIEEAQLPIENMYIIANNGATIYDCCNSCNIYEDRLSLDMVKQLWQETLSYGLHIHTYTDNSILSCADDPEIKYYTRRIKLAIEYTNSPWELMDKMPFKLLAISLNDHDYIDNFAKLINSKYPNIQAIFSNPMYLELFSKKAGKGTALKWLCNHLGIDLKDSFAAGDAYNDLSMIIDAGTGIAMCNGDPELFKYADVISSLNNNENGLVDCLKKLL